jgi:hypothetical protein
MEKENLLDDTDIQVGPLKIQIENIKDLKIGEKLPNSEIEEIVLQIGKKKVKTLDKSFYHARGVWEYFLNTYKIEENNLVSEISKLISEKKYNYYLNSIKQGQK